MLTILCALSQAANESWLSIPFAVTDAAAWVPGKKLGFLLVKVVFVHLLLTSATSLPTEEQMLPHSAAAEG